MVIKGRVLVLVTAALVVTMLLAACQPAASTETEGTTVKGEVTTPTTTPTTTTPTTTTPTTTEPEVDYTTTPYYGGVGTFSTSRAGILGQWDPGYLMHRPFHASAYLEGLTQGDWTKGPQGTNEFAWSNQTIPATCLTGLLSESWEMVDDYTIIHHLRKDIRYVSNDPAVPGNGREMVAADLVAAAERTQLSPRSTTYRGDEGRDNKNWVAYRAIDKYTVEITNPTPILRMSDGAIASAYPPEAVAAYGDLENWRHAIGTGPWILTDFVPDSSISYKKNPNYWQNDPLRPEYKMPYMDAYRYLIIPDEMTRMAAISTHKVLTHGSDFEKGEILMKSNPELKKTDRPSNYNVVIFMRNDIEPFTDIRVRKALAIAIDRQVILDELMRGVGTMNAWPVWESVGYDIYVPLEELPADIAELYEYDPAKAKQYLTDAGYPNGLQLELLAPQVEAYIDRATIVKSYWDAIGVKTTINVIESGTFYPRLYGKNYDQTAIVAWGNSSEESVLGWCWRTDILYNYGKVSDPVIDEAWDTTRITVDPDERAAVYREAYLHGMAQAWDICLPQPIDYVFWQPYMHGYFGEYCTTIAQHLWLDPVEMAKWR